jgi:hypothetical protein
VHVIRDQEILSEVPIIVVSLPFPVTVSISQSWDSGFLLRVLSLLSRLILFSFSDDVMNVDFVTVSWLHAAVQITIQLKLALGPGCAQPQLP